MISIDLYIHDIDYHIQNQNLFFNLYFHLEY